MLGSKGLILRSCYCEGQEWHFAITVSTLLNPVMGILIFSFDPTVFIKKSLLSLCETNMSWFHCLVFLTVWLMIFKILQQ